MRALIVDPRHARGSLAGVRGLAGAGWTVGVASQNRAGFAASSRHCSRWHRIGCPEDGLGNWVDALNAAIRTEGYEVVLCSADRDLIALSAERAAIRARVPWPSHDRVERALDKSRLTQEAAAAGLPTPRTWTAPEELPLKGPVIVKEALHAGGREGDMPARLCAHRDEATRRADEIRSAGGTPVFQEHVAGRLMAFSVVCDEEGRPAARVQQVAERTWPLDSGCSVRARTVPIDESLAASVARLTAQLEWFGLAQLQFMLPSDGVARLIDLNGRLYGSLALALGSGANLPAVWAGLAIGRPPAAVVDARPGRRYQWLEGDLERARDDGGFARGGLRCLRYSVGAQHSIWSLRDPRPAGRLVGALAGRARTRLNV